VYKYIKTFDFPAAANALRKDCEYLLNRLYPDNFKSTVGENGTIEELTLYGLICKLPKFYEYFDIPIKESNLDTYRERLLNPFSHDDLKTPLYRQELLLALNEVEELHKYKIAQIFSDEMIGKDSFHIEILNQLGEIEEANFIFLDRFYVIRVNDNYYYSNSRVKVINCSLNKTWHNDKEGKFRRLAKDLLNKANVEENHTFLLENVFAPPDGKSFMEIVDNLI
jgi:hypothetical protein